MSVDVTRLPTGDGVISAGIWPSSNRYTYVDDAVGSPDDVTTQLYCATATQDALFTFSGLSVPAGSTINYLRVTFRGYTENGVYWILPRLRVNGSNYNGAATISEGSWTTKSQDWTTNPATGAAWTVADVNGTGSYPLQQFGVQMNGQTSKTNTLTYLTQVYITCNYTAGAAGGVSVVGGAGVVSAPGAWSVVG